MCTAKRNAVKDFHSGKLVGRNKRSAVPARIVEDAATHCRNCAAKIVQNIGQNIFSPLVPAYYKSLTALRKTAPDA